MWAGQCDRWGADDCTGGSQGQQQNTMMDADAHAASKLTGGASTPAPAGRAQPEERRPASGVHDQPAILGASCRWFGRFLVNGLEEATGNLAALRFFSTQRSQFRCLHLGLFGFRETPNPCRCRSAGPMDVSFTRFDQYAGRRPHGNSRPPVTHLVGCAVWHSAFSGCRWQWSTITGGNAYARR